MNNTRCAEIYAEGQSCLPSFSSPEKERRILLSCSATFRSPMPRHAELNRTAPHRISPSEATKADKSVHRIVLLPTRQTLDITRLKHSVAAIVIDLTALLSPGAISCPPTRSLHALQSHARSQTTSPSSLSDRRYSICLRTTLPSRNSRPSPAQERVLCMRTN